MTRRATATAEKQPSLLDDTPQQAPAPKPVATTTKPAKKAGTAVSMKAERIVPAQSKSLIDRLREISDEKDIVLAREILAMIRSEEDRAAERSYNDAMLTVQSAIPAIKRDTFNKHTKSFWAKLEKISKIADPIIHKHGFSLSYGMETSPLPEHYRVICDVAHRDGHRRRYDADVGMDSKGPKGEGNKSLAQGSGSSVTYARRFLKVMIFDIVVEGMDNDGNGAEPRRADVIEAGEAQRQPVAVVTDDQAMKLVDLIAACGRTNAQFCKSWQIDKVADLPAVDYDDAVAKMKQLQQRNAAGGAR